LFIRRDKGTALLTTLLVLSFSAMTIMALVNIQQLLMYRTEQTLHSQENFQYAMGVEDWAKGRLFTYVNLPAEKKKEFPFPQILPLTPIPYGSTYGELFDAEGSYNINNLGLDSENNEETQNNFIAGLKAVYPDLKQENARELFQLIQNQFAQNNGAAKPQFLSSTELRASNLLTPQQFDSFSQWTIALPAKTPLSINTASAEAIVMASNGKVDLQSAQAMVIARQKMGWITNLEQLKNDPAFSTLENNKVDFGLEPQHFWVITTIMEGKSSYRLYTLLKVLPSGGTMDVNIVWRSYGTR
jgi:general secretion pathway protein K